MHFTSPLSLVKDALPKTFKVGLLALALGSLTWSAMPYAYAAEDSDSAAATADVASTDSTTANDANAADAMHSTVSEEELAQVFSQKEQAAIKQLVHDYLIAHPEILVEVAQALEAQQQFIQNQSLSEVIEFFRNDDFVPRRGDADAKHYLIEFFDYNCGYCKVVREYTKRLAQDYDLVTVYVEFPILSALSVRASAIGLALFAEDPAKYLEYQELLMNSAVRITDEDQIISAVKEVGGDYEKLSAQINDDPRIQQALRKNMELGQKIGVQGTPFFILDGTVIRGAVKDYSTFEDIVKAAETKAE